MRKLARLTKPRRSLWCVLSLAVALWAQQTAMAGDDPKAQVRKLVRQLDAPQLAQREAAEQELVKLGPAALEFLPQPDQETAAETKQRLGRIRQKLQQVAVQSTAQPSLITLRGQALALSKVLSALQQQSGNKIVDFRERFGQQLTDPPLTVAFDQTPFWQALDQVLDQAKLTVYPFGPERAIHIVARGPQQAPRVGRAGYSGPFRFEPVSVVAKRDLRDQAGESLQLAIEVMWEPRIQPIGLKQRLSEVRAVDERGNSLPVEDAEAAVDISANPEHVAAPLVIPLKLPSRDVQQVASLKATLTAMVPGRVETFRFGNLTTAKNVETRIAGTTVTFEQARKNTTVEEDGGAKKELWEVRMRVRFDEAGEALQSHRGWIFGNPAFLEGADGKPIAYDSLETTRQTENDVGIAYLFALQGPPAKLSFVYRTPGAIIATGFPYEIKGVKLP